MQPQRSFTREPLAIRDSNSQLASPKDTEVSLGRGIGGFTSDLTPQQNSQQFYSPVSNPQGMPVQDVFGDETPPEKKGGRERDLFDALEAAATPASERKLPNARIAAAAEVSAAVDPADFMDVVTAAAPPGPDVQLHAALEALDTVQHFAAGKAGTVGDPSASSETPGQRLAYFLKEQLVAREEARKRAQSAAADALRALAAKETELETTKQQRDAYRDQSKKAASKAQRLEATVGELQRRLVAAEQLAHDSIELARRKDAEAGAARRRTDAELESAQRRLAEMEMRLHMASPHPAASQRDVFGSPAGPPRRLNGERDRDDASVADSEDLVCDEAFEEVRAMARCAAKGVAVVQHGGGSEGVKADREKRQLSEEHLLRSEISTLERKCERAGHMLVKANHAMRVLHMKLQKERQTAAALQEEKCLLQSQLLAAADRPAGLEPEHLSALLQELAQARARVETLADERSSLAAKLTATEGLLSETDRAAAESASAGEAEAAARLEEARVRETALEARVDELVAQLSAAAAAASQLEGMGGALQEARERCGQLAAELEAERMTAAERASELSHLGEVAQSFATELMHVREEAQHERSGRERAEHDNAGLKGRLEALMEAVGRLERSDGVLESLAEGQAELQGRLRQAEAAAAGAAATADAARVDLQAERTRVSELEHTAEVLKSELAAAEEHNHALQMGAAAAGNQLAELAGSHDALLRELENAAEEAGIARSDAAALAQRAAAAEGRASEAERRAAVLQTSLESAEAREGALSAELQELAYAAQQAAAEAESARAAADQERRERDEARGRADRLDSSVRALTAECEGLRRAAASADGKSQTLVDSMCDMTGLIDAVTALQERTRLLQEDCDVASARAARAEAERDAAALHSVASDRELGHAKERLAAVAAAHQDLHGRHEELRAHHAVTERQLAALEEARAALAAEHSALQQRELELRAEVAAAAAEGQRLRAEADRLAAALGDAHARSSTSQAELQEALAQKESWLERERELHRRSEKMEKAHGVLEGKLVLAKQREEKYKEAAQHLSQLQADLASYLQEADALKRDKEAADDRAAELTGRCMVLLDQISVLEEGVEEEREERKALAAELAAVQACAQRLQGQVDALSTLPAQVAALETERQESARWCEDLTDELKLATEKLEGVTRELEEAQERCEALETRCEELEGRAAAATERAVAAETAAQHADAGRMEAAAALAVAEQTAAVANAEANAALREASGALDRLREAESAGGAAAERASRAEAELEALRADHATLEAALATSRGAQAAVEAALQYRIDQLEGGASESAGQQAQLEEARRRQVEELRSAVQAGSAACAALADKIDVAVRGQRESMEECTHLSSEVEELEAELNAARAALSTTTDKLERITQALEEARSEAAAAAAAHRTGEVRLEAECRALQRQVEVLEAAQARGYDRTDTMQRSLDAALQEQATLRGQLVESSRQLEAARVEAESARREAAEAETRAGEYRRAADTAAAEARRAVECAASDSRAVAVAKAEAERRVASLEQQLEVLELLKEHAARDAKVAREAAETARAEASAARDAADAAERRRLAAAGESKLAVHDLTTRISAQMAVLSRVEAAVNGSIDGGDGGGSTPAPSSAALSHSVAQMQGVLQEYENLSGGVNAAVDHRRAALLRKLSSVQSGVARLAEERAAQEERAATWQSEKAAMRAVCKLALAVTMDQVSGGGEAARVAADLADAVAANAAALRSLGLEAAWGSLRRLAGSSAMRAAGAEELAKRCARLEAEVATERRRAEGAEGAMRYETERLRGFAGSVRWAVGDLSPDATAVYHDETPSERLTACVDALGTAVQRLVRRYRALSRHMGSAAGEGTAEASRKFGAVASPVKAAAAASRQAEGEGAATDRIPAHLGTPRSGW